MYIDMALLTSLNSDHTIIYDVNKENMAQHAAKYATCNTTSHTETKRIHNMDTRLATQINIKATTKPDVLVH
jgi:hypothetical protein